MGPAAGGIVLAERVALADREVVRAPRFRLAPMTPLSGRKGAGHAAT